MIRHYIAAIARLTLLIWGHPANKHRRMRALASGALWQAYKRAVGKPIDIRVHGQLWFRCYPDSHDASRMVYFSGLPDPSEMIFMSRYLRPGDRFIDAGANVGIYTLLAAKIVGPSGHVIAFEPDPGVAERLMENVLRNDLAWVTIKSCAVADTAGTFAFTVGADTANTLCGLATSSPATRTVQTVTLDAEIKGEGYTMCKMDIEGAEFRALKGASTLLENATPPVWQLELTNRTLARFGSSVAEVQEWLRARGFDLWSYDHETNELHVWTMKPRSPGRVGDALAIARSALPMVQRRLGISAQAGPEIRGAGQ